MERIWNIQFSMTSAKCDQLKIMGTLRTVPKGDKCVRCNLSLLIRIQLQTLLEIMQAVHHTEWHFVWQPGQN